MARNNVKRLRKAEGLTQEELALRAGLTDGAIGHIETGRFYGRPATRHAIARALDVPYTAAFPPEMDEAHQGLAAA